MNGAAVASEGHPIKKVGTLYISAGLPGAGKSTFLKQNKKEEEVIISRDEIRFSLLKEGEDYFAHEDEVFRIFKREIIKNLLEGKNVYADATHLTPASQRKIASPVQHCTGCRVSYIYFNIPLEICLKRNENRKGTISYCPPAQIRKMARYADFTPTDCITNAWEVDINGMVNKIKRG